MANQERAEKWLRIVREDLSVGDLLFNNGHWLYTAYMCHQAIEKTLKAYWCVCRDDDPPFIHNHLRIAQGCGLYTKMSQEQKDFLDEMVPMNIEARYNEYKDAVAGILDREKTKQTLEKTKQLYKWILQRYSEKTKLLHSSGAIKK